MKAFWVIQLVDLVLMGCAGYAFGQARYYKRRARRAKRMQLLFEAVRDRRMTYTALFDLARCDSEVHAELLAAAAHDPRLLQVLELEGLA